MLSSQIHELAFVALRALGSNTRKLTTSSLQSDSARNPEFSHMATLPMFCCTSYCIVPTTRLASQNNTQDFVAHLCRSLLSIVTPSSPVKLLPSNGNARREFVPYRRVVIAVLDLAWSSTSSWKLQRMLRISIGGSSSHNLDLTRVTGVWRDKPEKADDATKPVHSNFIGCTTPSSALVIGHSGCWRPASSTTS